MSKNNWNIIITLFCWFCLFIHAITAIIGGVFLIHYFLNISIFASIILWISWIILSIFVIITLDANIK